MNGSAIANMRDRCARFLAAHRLGILSLGGPEGTWAMPVPYRSRELVIGCRLPRWAEIEFRLEGHSDVLLVVPDGDADCHWLAVQGHARITVTSWQDLLPAAADPPLPGELYQVVEITPTRLDLVDERARWGHRENLDL